MSANGKAADVDVIGFAEPYESGLRQLADGIWAWLASDGGWGRSNSGLIVGAEEALVVDTLWDQRSASLMMSAYSAASEDVQICYAVNTHSDGDHWWGNAVLPDEAFIITSVESARVMVEADSPGHLANLRLLARMTAPLHLGSLSVSSRYAANMLAPFEFRPLKLRHPDRAFSGSEQLVVGGREVSLIEVGPAHSPGDLIVHVADADVVFAGDVLFVGVTPVLWYGSLDGWLRALQRLLDLNAEMYVPGHGPPGDSSVVLEMRDYLSFLAEFVRSHASPAHSPLKLSRELVAVPEWRRWSTWVQPERVLITLASIQRELADAGPLRGWARRRVFAEVARFAAELPK